jgi:uncharacterized protein YbgA (DUF1722 family)
MRWPVEATSPERATLTFGKLELLGLIEDYRQGLLPLSMPLMYLRAGSNIT